VSAAENQKTVVSRPFVSTVRVDPYTEPNPVVAGSSELGCATVNHSPSHEKYKTWLALVKILPPPHCTITVTALLTPTPPHS